MRIGRFRRAAAALLMIGLAGASACCGKRVGSGADGVPPPSYESIAATYNDRVAALDSLWASAVVQLEWTEDDGDRRFEQGDGHIQIMQPDRFALSVGKFGEILYWMGSSGERYWFIDRNDGQYAFIGSHEAIAQLENSPLPAGPRELLVLAGVTPLPEGVDAEVRREGELIVVEPRTPGAAYRYTLRPPMYLPERITLLSGSGQPLLDAELADPTMVDVRGVTVDPYLPADVIITHLPTGGVMQLALSRMADRTPMGPIRPSVFDFERLVDRLGPLEVVDVDAALEEEREGS